MPEVEAAISLYIARRATWQNQVWSGEFSMTFKLALTTILYLYLLWSFIPLILLLYFKLQTSYIPLILPYTVLIFSLYSTYSALIPKLSTIYSSYSALILPYTALIFYLYVLILPKLSKNIY